MSSPGADTCRRALREIGEIAAVATLEDSQMSDQEALQAIAAIADWVRAEAPGERACGDVIRHLGEMTAGRDFDAMADREALDLFGEVLGALETSDMSMPALARSGPDRHGLT